MSFSYEIQGKLLKRFETQIITEKFSKREFILEVTSGQFSEQIKFQLTRDNCDFLEAYNEGDEITVNFNIKGKPYTNKEGITSYFTNLEAWRIQGFSSVGKDIQPTSKPKPLVPPNPKTYTPQAPIPSEPDNVDELPF